MKLVFGANINCLLIEFDGIGIFTLFETFVSLVFVHLGLFVWVLIYHFQFHCRLGRFGCFINCWFLAIKYIINIDFFNLRLFFGVWCDGWLLSGSVIPNAYAWRSETKHVPSRYVPTVGTFIRLLTNCYRSCDCERNLPFWSRNAGR